MLEVLLCFIGLGIFIAYNIAMSIINNGIPDSISQTSYISKRIYGVTWPFTMICVLSGVCIWPLWISLSPEEYKFLVFIACAGVIYVGSTPLYKEDIQRKIHYTAGPIAFCAGLMWLLLMKLYIPLGAIAVIGGIWTAFQPSKCTFIFEVVSYVAICITLLFLF